MRFVAIILGLSVMITAGIRITDGAVPRDPIADLRLVDGENSLDGLMEKFRQALETKDRPLLHRLRVTRDEYLTIIMPGSVEEGQPRAKYDKQAEQYFWSILDTKSIYGESNLLFAYGGKPLTLKSVEYRRGIKKYRDYTAYKQLTVTLDDGSTGPERVKIGSIAEVNGQYKFISFVRQ